MRLKNITRRDEKIEEATKTFTRRARHGGKGESQRDDSEASDGACEEDEEVCDECEEEECEEEDCEGYEEEKSAEATTVTEEDEGDNISKDDAMEAKPVVSGPAKLDSLDDDATYNSEVIESSDESTRAEMLESGAAASYMMSAFVAVIGAVFIF
jgi:hypothetical protein